MARDSRGMDKTKVELPVHSRTFINKISATLNMTNLRDTEWFPSGKGWVELGLLTEDGGPKWVMDNVIPAATSRAQGYSLSQTAILNGDVEVSLSMTAAEYSEILFRLQTGAPFGTNGFGRLTNPQRQIRWLVFHCEFFKSGRQRRRAFTATATVNEHQLERLKPLGHDIKFNLLPIVLAKSEDATEIGGISSPTYNDKGGIETPASPPADVGGLGSGLPGFNGELDGGPTIKIPGADSSDGLKLLDFDTEFDENVRPDEDYKNSRIPSVIDEIKPWFSDTVGSWYMGAGIDGECWDNGTIGIANQQVLMMPFFMGFKNPQTFTDLCIPEVEGSRTGYSFTFALYNVVQDGDNIIMIPNEPVKILASHTMAGETQPVIELDEELTLARGMYYIGIKRVDGTNVDMPLLPSSLGVNLPLSLKGERNMTDVNALTLRALQANSGNDSVGLTGFPNGGVFVQRAGSGFSSPSPYISLKFKESV